MIKGLLICGLVLLGSFASAQYNALYSQYLFNGMVINPAYTGSREVVTFSTSYRNQWVSFEGAPKTAYLSFEMPIKETQMSAGLEVINDQIGVNSNTTVDFSFAYVIEGSKYSTSFGLSGGASVLMNDWQSVKTTDPGDREFETSQTSAYSPNFGFGISYYNDIFDMGFSIPDLTTTGSSPDVANITTELNLGYAPILFKVGRYFNVTKKLKFYPSALARKVLKGAGQVDLNGMFVVDNHYGFGLGYRVNEAITGLVKIQINESIYLGYSYDVLLGDLSSYANSSHEVYFRYQLKYKKDVQHPRFF